MFLRLSPQYAVEDIHKFDTNDIGFQISRDERLWYIIGCYLAPDDTLTINSFVAALKELPQGLEMLVAGDLNADLEEPEGDQR